MDYRNVSEENREEYNSVVSHPLQSFEWGEFRKATGVKVVRRALFDNNKIVSGFTLTIHKIPKTKYTIGYLPKGILPTKELLLELQKIGKDNNCIFIQLEPNVPLRVFHDRLNGRQRCGGQRERNSRASGCFRHLDLPINP